jgi:hypothetical protein
MYYAFDETHYTNCTLVVPRGSKSAYQAADTWKNFLNIVEADFPVEGTRGDVNDDGFINVADVTALISYILGNNISINVVAANVNNDESINVADVTALITYILSEIWPGEIDLWYLIGDNVGFYFWENTPEAIGLGLIPLYPSGSFNAQGRGLLTYTGYFKANDEIEVIHQPGNYNETAGANAAGEFGIGANYGRFAVPASGYYTINLNTATRTFSFTPYTQTNPGVFTSMNMVGEHSSWVVTDQSYNMRDVNFFKENHDWMMQQVTFKNDGDVKFAADNDWEFNWGGDEFPFGTGVQSGPNIPMKAGTYDVFFNDITGLYNFIKL